MRPVRSLFSGPMAGVEAFYQDHFLESDFLGLTTELISKSAL